MRITLRILLPSRVRRREAIFEIELGSASHLTTRRMLEVFDTDCSFRIMYKDCKRRRLSAISSG